MPVIIGRRSQGGKRAAYQLHSFRIDQAFFPRTGAWDNLKRSLKGAFDDSLWDHLANTTSAPFAAGEHGRVAVKVIDDRGNELLVVEDLKNAVVSPDTPAPKTSPKPTVAARVTKSKGRKP